jgi:hypothetical protein
VAIVAKVTLPTRSATGTVANSADRLLTDPIFGILARFSHIPIMALVGKTWNPAAFLLYTVFCLHHVFLAFRIPDDAAVGECSIADFHRSPQI